MCVVYMCAFCVYMYVYVHAHVLCTCVHVRVVYIHMCIYVFMCVDMVSVLDVRPPFDPFTRYIFISLSQNIRRRGNRRRGKKIYLTSSWRL